MKKNTISVLIFVVCLSMLGAGCKLSRNEDYSIDAKTYFNIVVPRNSKIFFQLPWYQVSNVDYSRNIKENDHYIIGDNVKLIGQNIDQLDSTEIYVKQMNLKDLTGEDYCQTLLLEEDYVFNTGKYKVVDNEFVYPNQHEIDEAKRLLEPYIASTKILTFSLAFNGIVTKPVRVDSISIDSLNYEFDFDTFVITPSDLPINQTEELYNIIESFNSGGLLAGPSLSNYGYYFIEGTATRGIKEITNESLNDACEVINEKNHVDYKDFEMQNGISLYTDQKTTNIEKGEAFSLVFNYMYKGMDATDFRKYDSAVASIANIITLDDGTQYYNYIYQPSQRNAEYSLVYLLHTLR